VRRSYLSGQDALAEGLRGAILAGLFALPFLALFLTPRLYFPFVTPRTFAFRAIVELVFAAWVWLAIRDVRYRPRRSALLVCFCAALMAMAAADALGADPARSFFGNFLRMEGYATLLHLFAFFLVAGAVLDSETLWRRFFAASLAASVLVAYDGLLQRLGVVPAPWGVGRIDATFGNPAYLAGYLVINGFVAGFLLVRARGAGRAALGAALALDLWVLWLTATRGAVVGLAAGAVALALAALWRGGARARRWAAAALVLTLLAGGGVIAASHSPLAQRSAMLARFGEIGSGDATGAVRLRVWAIAWQAIRERPLLGWGQENFTTAVDRHFDPVLARDAEWVDRAHNLVLDWLVAGGVVGGLAYLSLFAVALALLWRRGRAEDAVLAGLLVGDFVALLFLFDSLATYLLFVTVLAYLHAGTPRRDAAKAAAPAWPGRAAGPALACCLAVAWVLGARGLLACAALERALVPAAAPLPVAAQPDGSVVVTLPPETYDGLVAERDGLRRAIGYGSFGTPEAREDLALVAYDLLLCGDDPWVRANVAPYAVEEMTQQVRDEGQVRDMLFLGSLLVALDRFDEGIAVLDRAAALAPRRQSIVERLAVAYQGKGDTAKALDLRRQAFALDPGYDPARLAYAAAAIAAGGGEIGRRLLVERYGTDLVPDDRIIAAYRAANEPDKVVELWRKRVASEPGNASYHVALAAALKRAGRDVDALKELGALNRVLTRPGGE
jgi:O-antigen ligase/Flp pilus assembly protein TadD